MGLPAKAIYSIVQHAPVKALEHLPGVNLHTDDPTVMVEWFDGVDGQTDIFVFDASVPSSNITLLSNFDSGEDFFMFRNMEGRELTVGDLGYSGDGSHAGSHFVLFHGTGEGANIIAFGVDYQQDTIEKLVMPFNGQLVFDDPLQII